MKTCLIIFALLFIKSELYAQWSVNVLEHYKKNAELTIGLNNRSTHILGEFGTIYGLKLGLNFNKKLKNTFIFSSTIWQLGEEKDGNSSFETAQLHFISLAEELTFYQKKRFATIAFFSLGYGINNRRVFAGNNRVLSKSRIDILPLEIGLIGSYEVLQWLDLRIGFGWRYLLLGSGGLNGYFFKLGLGFRYKSFRRTFNI